MLLFQERCPTLFMIDEESESGGRQIWPWAVMACVLAASAYLLHSQGRLWIAESGRVLLWSGNAWSADNSQHFLDPYSFTHILHGLALCWLLGWLFPRLSRLWRLSLAISLESLWEVIENSAYVIERYRAATAALGYTGDTVINSLGDIVMCGLGFWLAQWLGFRRSLVMFVLVELVLVVWIRDSLLLNIVMLLYPLDQIKAWQMGQ